MKILSLHIQGYKNLKDKTKANFDFLRCSNYVALIGLNGSGKSNVLECISIIFSNLYQKSTTPFEYELVYEINGDTVKIVNDIMSVKSKRIIRDNHFQYLPSNVITSYSGEELRMWEEVYFASYSAFFRDIKSSTETAPNMLYINKHVWEYALLALLSSDKPPVKAFIKDVLKIDPDKVTISFEFNDDNIKTYPKNKAILFVESLIKLQIESKGKLVLNQINSINPDALNNNALVRRLFYNLFITGMPVRNDKAKIYTDKIIHKSNVSFNDIDVKNLSEGEKKLILVNCITHLLADEQTLILLDEPDAHIHIERKKEIIDIINQPDHFTIFTTHSPKILHCIKDENVRIIKTTDSTGLEAIYLDKVKALDNLTNGEFSIVDATLALSTTKDILLVEGTNDYNYLIQARKQLAPDYDNLNFHIINCGGADNVPAVLEQSLLSVLNDNQLCLCTFDFDQQGILNFNKIEDLATVKGKTNIKAMYHPKTDGSEHSQGDNYLFEEYFPIEAYRDKILDKVKLSTNFKTINGLQKAKGIIESNYLNFENKYFVNFKVFFDYILKIQEDFHKSKGKSISKVVNKSTAKKVVKPPKGHQK